MLLGGVEVYVSVGREWELLEVMPASRMMRKRWFA